MTIAVAPVYQILRSLSEDNRRFRDFLALGIQKATLAKLLLPLEERDLIQRKVVSTRPLKMEYSITAESKKFLIRTEHNIKEYLPLIV